MAIDGPRLMPFFYFSFEAPRRTGHLHGWCKNQSSKNAEQSKNALQAHQLAFLLPWTFILFRWVFAFCTDNLLFFVRNCYVQTLEKGPLITPKLSQAWVIARIISLTWVIARNIFQASHRQITLWWGRSIVTLLQDPLVHPGSFASFNSSENRDARST